MFKPVRPKREIDYQQPLMSNERVSRPPGHLVGRLQQGIETLRTDDRNGSGLPAGGGESQKTIAPENGVKRFAIGVEALQSLDQVATGPRRKLGADASKSKKTESLL